MHPMQGARVAFGPFVLDPEAGTLLRHDMPVAVGHRGITLLAALAGQPGEILTKSELMEAAWRPPADMARCVPAAGFLRHLRGEKG
jgi:DNA-binding winged helix-turn-helix (wHTH) protein